MPTSRYELQLEALIRSMGERWPSHVTQHIFASPRRWRLDFAWPALKVGIEVDGGARLVKWQRNPRTGRNQPVAVGHHGTAKDYEKLNMLAELGWRVLRFNPDMLRRPLDVVASIDRTLLAASLQSQRSDPPPAP